MKKHTNQEDFIESLPDNFRILEEPIDTEIQHEYFQLRESSEELNKPIPNLDELLNELANLSTIEKQRILLIQIARSRRVDSYAIIKDFMESCSDKKLKSWATLALQECRMVLESDLSDEEPVFISTGLGGKEQNMRYFFVFLLHNAEVEFSNLQKKTVKTELKFQLDNEGGKLEKVRFNECYAIGTFLFPLKKELQPTITNFLAECSLYGNFLHDNFIITNVKKMSLKQIKSFFRDEIIDTDTSQLPF